MTVSPISSVVVGVDGSPGGAHALRWAAAEADLHGAELTAVMAWGFLDQHHSDPSVKFDPQYDEAAALAVLGRHLDDVVGPERAATVVRAAPCNIGGRALIEASDGADLLVVGARGLGGFKGLLIGSVSQHCLQHSTVPVAVIRDGIDAPGAERRGVVVGIDESATADRALAWALAEARARSTTVHVLHAWQLPVVGHEPIGVAPMHDVEAFETAARRRLDASLQRAGATRDVTGTIRRGNPASVVLDAAEDAELVVVGTRGLGALKRILLGSVATQVTQHATSPVVVIPPSPKEQST